MLAGAAIGEHEIERICSLAPYHRASVFTEHRQSWVRSKVRPGDRLNLGIDVDGHEPRCRIHAVQQPAGADPGSGADFEQAAARLQGSHDPQQGADLGPAPALEAEFAGISNDGFERTWGRLKRSLVHG